MSGALARLEAQLRRSFEGGAGTPHVLRRPEGDASPLAGTAYTHFIGITQHDLYHAGQIAILKRALAPTATR